MLENSLRMQAVVVAFDSTFNVQSGAWSASRLVDISRLAWQAPIDLALARRAECGKGVPGPTH
jgi:hypothetical protein